MSDDGCDIGAPETRTADDGDITGRHHRVHRPRRRVRAGRQHPQRVRPRRRPGEFVGIIGPNGAGKSTLLKAVLGLVPVRSGSVTLHGETSPAKAHELVQRGRRLRAPDQQRVPDPDGAREPRDGLLPEAQSFVRSLRGRDELFPRLGERADQKAGVALGWRAPDGRHGPGADDGPELLLLDEPSAGLSPLLQDEVFIRCKPINDAGVAILMVEQNAAPVPAGVRPGLRARPGHERLHRHRARAAGRPQGHRALPRHAGRT